LRALDDLIKLLRRYGVRDWPTWLERDRALIDDGDAQGLDHLLSAFGGMGSLNDLVIHPTNGHDIRLDDTARVDHDLMRLTGEVHHLAGKLRHQAPP